MNIEAWIIEDFLWQIWARDKSAYSDTTEKEVSYQVKKFYDLSLCRAMRVTMLNFPLMCKNDGKMSAIV